MRLKTVLLPWVGSAINSLRSKSYTPQQHTPFNSSTDMKSVSSSLEQKYGKVWQGDGVASARETGQQCRVCFRNRSDRTLILCWMSEKGTPHHFYALPPWKGRGKGLNLRGSRVKELQVLKKSDGDHIETTHEGHAFCIADVDDVKETQKRKSLEGDGVTIVGGYRPEKPMENVNPEMHQSTIHTVHLVEIVDTENVGSSRSLIDLVACCFPKRQRRNLRHGNGNIDDAYNSDDEQENTLRIVTRMVCLDNTPFDTTSKCYEACAISDSKWPVQLEANWYGSDKQLELDLEQDLQHLTRCLPEHAVKLLRDDSPTPIWINKSLCYGPKDHPIKATNMCFHPGVDWLIEQGMHPEKAECVELYSAEHYRSTRHYWGIGGLLLHEFSHAYHHKGCVGGYSNTVIKECYEAAMAEGLYENVRVKGPQGPKTKAYACTNCMEYFAELSTAFLGGTPERQRERECCYGEGSSSSTQLEEYNKWYPFNRQQLKEHDPRAYEMLAKIWKVEVDN